MCGICGKIGKPNTKINRDLVKKMNDKIIHRGPDEDGYFFHDNVGLAMRRLSVIDLIEGQQPIYNETRELVIVFNGEIYNYKHLRKELESLGHVFYTNSDTEVIIHSYEKYGIDCLQKLNGMFAFAIYNRANDELVIARDRLGVKPLYYYSGDKGFIFGSELKCIITDDEIPKQLDEQAVNDYFSLFYIPAPKTIYRDIKKLPPAHYLIYKSGELTVKRYWNLSDKKSQIIESKDECIFKIKELVKDAVKSRMYTDVSMGTFLSGGIDSSIVTSILATEANWKVNTFSIGYKNEKLFDESDLVRLIVNKYNTEHHELFLEERDLLNCLDEIISNIDEPFADSSMIPTYLVSKLARQDVTVALSGDGGDEMFGGYTKYTIEYYRSIYNMLPESVQHHIESFIMKQKASFSNGLENFYRKAQKFIRSNNDSIEQRYFNLSQVFNDEERLKLFNDNRFLKGSSMCKIVNIFNESSSFDKLYRYMYADLHFALPEDMLVKVDRMSMLSSLEVRSPFLDYRIAELSINIPTKYKLNRKEGKVILKEAFKDYLPKEIVHGPKKGFGVPIGKWFKRELRTELIITLSEENIKKIGFLNYQYIIELINEHLSDKLDHSWKLWTLYIFIKWFLGYNS